MSNNGPSTGVGRTLAGGVQDVAAILPLIGTEQCEKHTGSALKGGYLYAAAAPLSIFGSLGIVKAGIAIVISSISIPIPHLSFSFRGCTPSVKCSLPQKWLGGRMLKDAGFELTGVVAPLIGMDGDRFRAETRLMEMLEEKHIDDPEKITVDWKSRHWNKMLVISTILGAALSLTPYIALLLGPASWRPNGIHIPWLFPALRIVGSCIAAIACQFLIQFRVISLMKNRILFMIIHRRLKAIPKQRLGNRELEWDGNLPAEKCIWSLKQYLSSGIGLPQWVKDVKKPQSQTVVQRDAAPPPEGDSDYISIPVLTSQPTPPSPLQNDTFDIHKLHELQREHFPTPARDTVFTTLLWILLGLSLPATVTGYIGCFTLVGATPAQGNGPLVWVGLEATLSVLRIIIWASNPSFDEETDITLKLELSVIPPTFPTEDSNPFTTNQIREERNPVTLVPEREFLERMTPFTGPLDQFPRPNNITLYFTLISNHVSLDMSEALLVTVFDLNMQLGVTFGVSQPQSEEFDYWDVTVKYDTVLRKFQAHIHSEKRHTQPWRLEDDKLFTSLQKYHKYIFYSFSERKRQVMNEWSRSWSRYQYSNLTLRWDISTQAQSNDGFQAENPINENSRHLDRIHLEWQSKPQLILTWASWIVKTMGTLRSHTQIDIDCDVALEGKTSQKGIWELAGLDIELVWEWTNRELVLLTLSLELEDILCSKMEARADEISRVRQDEQVMTWMRADFENGRQKRMEREREAATQRMARAMATARKEAKREGRLWQGDAFSPQWTQAIEFIEKQWSAGINNGREGVTAAEDELKRLIQNQGEAQRQLDNERSTFVEHKKPVWHEHWRHQHRHEEHMMKATAENIRALPADSTRSDLDMAYNYPNPDKYATAKFVGLSESSSKGKACVATVYDAYRSDQETVCDVIAKSTTRSVVRVNPKFVASIPPNDHLLFLQSRGSEAEEPAFVKRNRDRWWDQQTGNASMFYFSPGSVDIDGHSCYQWKGAIAHIFVFLTGTTPSAVQVGVLHSRSKFQGPPKTLSIQENGQELASISGSKLISGSFQLDSCQSFMLQPGRHELKLVPNTNGHILRDIFLTISDLRTAESDQGVFATIQDPHSEGRSS